MSCCGEQVKESWLAKLGNWSEALGLYEQKRRRDPQDTQAVLGLMKCWDALGQWDEVRIIYIDI